MAAAKVEQAASVVGPVPAERSGYLIAVDARAIGVAVIGQGGKRKRIGAPRSIDDMAREIGM